MNIFGLKILTKKRFAEVERCAEAKALYDLIGLLRKADRIFLEPVILNGDNQIVSDCVFLGYGLTVNSSDGEEV